MNATEQRTENPQDKIILLGGQKTVTPKAPPKVAQRFNVREFVNRAGSKSWRVDGYKRDGSRVRENFFELAAAQCRQIELETEYLRGHAETEIRATKLSEEQLRLAEAAYIKLGDDWQRILDAVGYWQTHGRKHTVVESPRLDDAVTKFKAWLDGARDENGNGVCTLREHSRKGLRIRVAAFANSIRNLHVDEITPDTVEGFLGRLNSSATTKDNYRRAVSRFFSWCIERPRRWATTNPCREIRIDKGEKSPPVVLTMDQCKAMLKKAQAEGIGAYIALCLFGGLRPFEAGRLTWQQINMKDGEIRLEANQTKTGRARVVAMCDTLLAWLKANKGKPLFPKNWRRRFDRVKKSAGFDRSKGAVAAKNPWTPDAMRHTAISHFFRKTGSYGQTAEQFGNSEAIIKAHYQGRVSSEDTKKFYAILPTKSGRR